MLRYFTITFEAFTSRNRIGTRAKIKTRIYIQQLKSLYRRSIKTKPPFIGTPERCISSPKGRYADLLSLFVSVPNTRHNTTPWPLQSCVFNPQLNVLFIVHFTPLKRHGTHLGCRKVHKINIVENTKTRQTIYFACLDTCTNNSMRLCPHWIHKTNWTSNCSMGKRNNLLFYTLMGDSM